MSRRTCKTGTRRTRRRPADAATGRIRHETQPIAAWMRQHKTFPNFSAIAAATGLSRQEIGYAFTGSRRTPRVQDAVARHAGMSTAEMFGEWAWFKGVAQDLETRLNARRVSA